MKITAVATGLPGRPEPEPRMIEVLLVRVETHWGFYVLSSTDGGKSFWNFFHNSATGGGGMSQEWADGCIAKKVDDPLPHWSRVRVEYENAIRNPEWPERYGCEKITW